MALNIQSVTTLGSKGLSSIRKNYRITLAHTCSRHADGRLVDHTDDGDRHGDALSVEVKKYEEAHNGNAETR